MKKIPISGGPSSGKTTTLESLKILFSDAHFVPEPAERVIKREILKLQQDPKYKPIFPVTSYPEFTQLVIEESKKLESEIPSNATLVFQDRSFIDNIGYGYHNNFTTLFPQIKQLVKAANYTMAFFCEPLSVFEQTEIRHETAEDGLKLHEHLLRAYSKSGLNIVKLPPVSVEQRAKLIYDIVRSL